MAQEYCFDHPQLGQLISLPRGEDVVQFRGVPFATIEARFRQSKLAESLPSRPFDARQPGPICPQPSLPFPEYWDGPLPAGGPEIMIPEQHEFDCLNLCTSVPKSALQQGNDSRLPVYVYIHGGAFVAGSQSIQLSGRELYDGTYFVRSSIQARRPIIVVTINYRVGPLGFLASKELTNFNQANGEAVGNYGLHDQRQALKWIAKFVSGFGGDPTNVTINGTSAGGASCHYLCMFPDRNFRRAILSSGTALGIGPLEESRHQRTFDKFVKAFVPTGSEPSIVKDLQKIPVNEFVTTIPSLMLSPLIDGVYITTHWATDVPSKDAPDIMLGACEFEADIGRLMISDPTDIHNMTPLPNDLILKSARTNFRFNGLPKPTGTFPDSAPKVCEKYHISKRGLSEPRESFEGWVQLGTDIVFRFPPLYIARTTPRTSSARKVYLYEFKAPNPYAPGTMWFGRANHGANDLFVLNPAEDLVGDHVKPGFVVAVKTVQDKWLDFIYGESPWTAYNDLERPGTCFVFDDGEESYEAANLAEAVGKEKSDQFESIWAMTQGVD
ncbi:hypothetical protein MBLNU457_3184t1 [Dothideomycetes sp. NU457]